MPLDNNNQMTVNYTTNPEKVRVFFKDYLSTKPISLLLKLSENLGTKCSGSCTGDYWEILNIKSLDLMIFFITFRQIFISFHISNRLR